LYGVPHNEPSSQGAPRCVVTPSCSPRSARSPRAPSRLIRTESRPDLPHRSAISSWRRSSAPPWPARPRRRSATSAGRPRHEHGRPRAGPRPAAGVPTANLELDADLGLAPGVYAGLALARPAAINVGVRPTFGVDGTANVEVHIIGFDGDLYGQELTVELLAWIRAERRFDGIDELVAQLKRDVAAARALSSRAPCAWRSASRRRSA
jgi:hypothetical protein